MQQEVWLRTNRRALLGAAIPVALLLLGGLWLSVSGRAFALGAALAVLGGALLVAVIVVGRRPRLAFANEELIVYLRRGAPLAVPIEHVECFFLGQGPSRLPNSSRATARNIVVRLAESARAWKFQEVQPELGQWCDGYITIRGLWTEPITPTLLHELNERLRRAHRELRASPEENQEHAVDGQRP